jgi:hypothetical protein
MSSTGAPAEVVPYEKWRLELEHRAFIHEQSFDAAVDRIGSNASPVTSFNSGPKARARGGMLVQAPELPGTLNPT